MSAVDEIVIYEKPTCSKCRVAIQLLDKRGVPYRRVRYHDTPLTKKKLVELIKKLNVPVQDLVRTHDPVYRTLKLNLASLSEAEIIDLLLLHPDVLQRPIIEKGDTAIIGRPTERVTKFLELL